MQDCSIVIALALIIMGMWGLEGPVGVGECNDTVTIMYDGRMARGISHYLPYYPQY
jgi:hypothetical protein